jgi:hypothetical protein
MRKNQSTGNCHKNMSKYGALAPLPHCRGLATDWMASGVELVSFSGTDYSRYCMKICRRKGKEVPQSSIERQDHEKLDAVHFKNSAGGEAQLCARHSVCEHPLLSASLKAQREFPSEGLGMPAGILPCSKRVTVNAPDNCGRTQMR